MAKESQGSFRPGKRESVRECVSEQQRIAYPCVCTLLEGQVGTPQDAGFAPYKLTLQVGVKGIRWSFSCYESGHSIFGASEGFADILTHIEGCLQDERFDQKWYERKEN